MALKIIESNRWQEYTELYKTDLHDPDNHDGVITHLEPDILECQVKWALESITTNKTSGGDGIPVKLFKILNDDAVKVLHSINMPANLENSAVATGLENVSFHSIPRKGSAKECSNYCIIALISHAAAVAAAAARLLQSCPTLCDPIDGRPPSLGFSRQEHWSGLPFPSPMHESEK